tara:strand:- start:608 stop:1000 length:393 start_codon:yes stop_codon:yes gene_type:complete
MVLNSENIDRLNKIRRQLPKTIEAAEESGAQNFNEKKKKHKIETEDNPEILFHALMDASCDGSIPSHLINRLQQLENKEKNLNPALKIYQSDQSKNNKPGGKSIKKLNQEENLYLKFQNLLLEEEEEEDI